ncbi:putative endosialidase [Hafnia phage Pocis76]|uniref:Putative endosialidase n=1 Tax=Hafnia phage Pocis76 TaxID=2831174 RepID=A0A8E7KYV5_9CAUD|nr:putative endosialidase [Hafnia phage Pocis76]
MALYRTGQASLSADGVITGYKTKWMQPLSLIRKEATIMFLSPNGLKMAVIAEIISDTQMRAIATGGAVVEKCDYAILIHDSLTVDGMAQDVAETLRYYRSRETEFAHLIEVIEDMDLEKIQKVVEDMRAEVAKFEENFKKIEAKAQEVQANADKVADEVAIVQQIHVRVDELSEQAKANADRAHQNYVLSQDEVRKARQEADNATGEAVKAKAQADRASQIVEGGKQEIADAVASGKVEVGQGIEAAVGQATAQADRAQREADRAADLAAGFDGTNMLRKDRNLSDLNDKVQARKNLGALTTGDFGLGYKANRGIAPLNGGSGFFASGEPADIGGLGSAAGFQASYGNERRGQMAITLDGSAFYRFCNTASNDKETHPWKQLVAVGDYGIGAVNPPKINNSVTNKTGLYSALTNDIELGKAWSIEGQAVGIINLGVHPDRSNDFKSQIATSYSSNGRLFYRCSDAGTWKAWRELAVSGLPNFNMASGFNISNTKGSQSYVVFRVENKGRASTDNGSQVAIEIPHTAERPYLLQRRNDGTTTGQIVNSLPTLHGELLCRNNYVLNMANKNFNDLANTQFVSFISGGTAHGAQNTPNVGYGNMLVIGSGGATTGNYTTQLLFDKHTAIPYVRCRTDGNAAWTAWQKVTVAAVSDENLKNIRGNLNVEGALDNINRMEFKIFAFKDDETQRYRRGVISQQIKKIDKDYVNMVGDRMVLDQTPMMLDGLAAIKALRARDEDNKKRIAALESEVAELKELVKSLIGNNKPTTLEEE